jgi:hypothetical protein
VWFLHWHTPHRLRLQNNHRPMDPTNNQRRYLRWPKHRSSISSLAIRRPNILPPHRRPLQYRSSNRDSHRRPRPPIPSPLLQPRRQHQRPPLLTLPIVHYLLRPRHQRLSRPSNDRNRQLRRNRCLHTHLQPTYLPALPNLGVFKIRNPLRSRRQHRR